MGREIKRVAVDFDWPLNKIWSGYVNPYDDQIDCVACNGLGYSKAALKLYKDWYGNGDFTPAVTGSMPYTIDHPSVIEHAKRNAEESIWLTEHNERIRLANLFNERWCHHLDQDDVNALLAAGLLWHITDNDRAPTVAEVNDWSILSWGHDSINMHICIDAKCKRLGLGSADCPVCGGEGAIWHSKAAQVLYESWQPVEPPTGEGYQVWETVSDGSPVSPVFANRDDLYVWLVNNGYESDGAREFIKREWAPSAVITPDGVKNGIDALGDLFDV